MIFREDILNYLMEQEDTFVSGKTLSSLVSGSGKDVWKTVRALRREGHHITAVPRLGYRYRSPKTALTAAKIRRYLPPDLPYRVTAVAESPSTNSAVKALAESGEEAWYVLVADRQTQGRGRMGRQFYSPSGTGIYASVLLRPNLPPSEGVFLTVVAAVAAVTAVKRVCNVEAQIKWVNDLYVDGRKVCGILTESAVAFETGRLQYAVCGIGFNVAPPPEGFPEELQNVAGALLPSCDGDLRARLTAAFLEEFYRALRRDRALVLDEYRKRSMLIGRTVRSLNGAFHGPALALGIDDSAGLQVRLSDGSEQTLSSGEVSVRPCEPEPISPPDESPQGES